MQPFGQLALHFSAVGLGLVSGLIAAGYSELLELCIHALWHKLPDAIIPHDSTVGPLYVLVLVTLAATVIGLLATVLPPTGNMDEWIDLLHTKGVYPSNRLSSQLLLSFITAACGFSVGPEAPLVITGAIMGSKVAAFFEQPAEVARVLNLSAAAGCLAGFFGLPLVGALFVLELPHKLGLQYYEALSPAMAASIAAAIVAKQVTQHPFTGKYLYPQAETTSPASIAWLPIFIGLVSAVIAVLSVLLIKGLKRGVYSAKHRAEDCTGTVWVGPLIVKIVCGLIVGAIGVLYPQTLFWGELNLQSGLDGQSTPLFAIGEGPLVGWAVVDPDYDVSYFGALQVACFKVLAIAFSAAGGFPGGVIFPFFFAGAYFGRAACCFGPFFQHHMALVTTCSMAAIQACVTKTPLSSSLLILVTASSFADTPQQVAGAVLPLIIISVYTGFLAAHTTRVTYSAQSRSRDRRSISDASSWDVHREVSTKGSLSVEPGSAAASRAASGLSRAVSGASALGDATAEYNEERHPSPTSSSPARPLGFPEGSPREAQFVSV